MVAGRRGSAFADEDSEAGWKIVDGYGGYFLLLYFGFRKKVRGRDIVHTRPQHCPETLKTTFQR